jgi:hypothetical protein
MSKPTRLSCPFLPPNFLFIFNGFPDPLTPTQAYQLHANNLTTFTFSNRFFLPIQAYKLRAELDKLASFGRPIWITEMDSAEVDEQKKADMLEFAYREYFAHPAVEGILMWTVWQGPATTCQV